MERRAGACVGESPEVGGGVCVGALGGRKRKVREVMEAAKVRLLV